MKSNVLFSGWPACFAKPLHITLLAMVALLALQTPAAEFEFESGDNWLAEEEVFLKVDEAFALTAQLNDDGALIARWDMPDGYYLYRHQFLFEAKDDSRLTIGEPAIPPGKRKIDDYFGEVEVYYHSAEIVVPLASQPGVNTQIGVNYQGCADAGLCYPPETRWFAYDGMRLISASLPTGVQAGSGNAESAVTVDVGCCCHSA